MTLGMLASILAFGRGLGLWRERDTIRYSWAAAPGVVVLWRGP